ncbi:Hpt domain-containing protein [Lachnospiraceae bacterium JLR.KK008]
MTVKECYDKFGGDYEGVISRLLSEERVKKYMLKFLDDGSFELLCTSLEAGNMDDAFRAAHTLKGVCQNLGFERLYVSSDQLTELLRDREKHDVSELLKKTEEDYMTTISAIRMLQG